MVTVKAKIHVDHEEILHWSIPQLQKHCINITLIKMARKEDQYHSGEEREVLLQKQDIYFDSKYDLTQYSPDKDKDKILAQ